MPKYPREFIDSLKDMALVHDVIQTIIGSVEKVGNMYMAKCPFHDDQKPSLMINPSTNTWSCLACGAGSKLHSRATSSDVIGFIRGYYNCEFDQAIDWLAKYLQVPLPVLDPQQAYKQNQYEWWVQKCHQAQHRFQQNLLKNKDAYKYLRNRGIEDLEIEIWGLGFGDGEDKEFLNTKGKITFPIHDFYGNIISFTGRVPFDGSVLADLNEKEKAEGKRVTPKYDHRWPLTEKYVDPEYLKNHPYPSFDRNQYLYGIYQAKNYIQQWKRAILVEGFTDVIQLHKHGVNNAVATMGTNISESHIQQLKRAGAQHILLMRDADVAGLKAMERDSKVLLPHGFKVTVCPLPEGHDPDTLSRSFGLLDDAFVKYINKRTRTLSQWRIERIYRERQDEILYHYASIGEIQGERMDKVVQLIAEEPDPIEQDILLRQYADLFVMSYDSLKEKVMLFKNQSQLITA